MEAMDGIDAALDALDSEFAAIAAAAPVMDDHQLINLAAGFDDSSAELTRAVTPLLLRRVVAGAVTLFFVKLGDRLNGAWKDHWNDREGIALERFLIQWWTATLACDPADASADDLLTVLLQLDRDTTVWLDVWEAVSSETSDRQLADLVRWWVPDLLNGTALEADLGTDRDQREYVVPWLLRYGRARMRLRRDAPGFYGLALILLDVLAETD